MEKGAYKSSAGQSGGGNGGGSSGGLNDWTSIQFGGSNVAPSGSIITLLVLVLLRFLSLGTEMVGLVVGLALRTLTPMAGTSVMDTMVLLLFPETTTDQPSPSTGRI